MNFNEYKDSFFSGDKVAALKQLAKEGYSGETTTTSNGKELQKILDSMDQKTARQYMKFFYKEFEKNPERFFLYMKISRLLTHLNMEPEEIVNAEKNPFIKKFLRIFSVFLLILLLTIILLCLDNIFDFNLHKYAKAAPAVCAIFVTPVMAGQLINIFRFKKAKKLIIKSKMDLDTPDEVDEYQENSNDDCLTSQEDVNNDRDSKHTAKKTAITRSMTVD